jgi:hypothetical protein
MKKILGSILIITINIFASSLCDFNLTLSNHSPYVKEGVKIEFSVTQKDISQAMFFEFTPQKSKDYELVFIKKEIIPLSLHLVKRVIMSMFYIHCIVVK